jgi:hypothetical protein
MENPRKVRNGQRTTLMSVILWPSFFLYKLRFGKWFLKCSKLMDDFFESENNPHIDGTNNPHIHSN